MKQETFNSILVCVFILLFFGLFMRGLATYSKDTVWRNDNFCKLKYNATERDSDSFFGKYCAVPNYSDYTVKKYYYTNQEMYDYCETNIKFFELNRWKDKCS